MYVTALSNSLPNINNRVNIVDPYQSGVDVVHPNRLDIPSTITRSSQDRPHLIHAREQVPACHEPPDALGARRSCQAALVSPVLVEPPCVIECQFQVQGQWLLYRLCFVPMDHWGRELLDESRVLKTWLHANAQNCSRVSLCVDVHKVELGSGAARSYSVIGRCVNVPPNEVNGRVVVGQTRVASVVVFFMRKCERRSETPVVEIAFKCPAVVEARFVGEGRTMLGHQMDGCLVSARVAHLIV